MIGNGVATWFPWRSPRSSAEMRLFCLPYAGGNGTIFRGWEQAMPPGVDVCPVQLPGRGTRLHEAPFTRARALVARLADAIDPHLDRPFCLFGHSMGALLAFEVARHLRERGRPSPAVLFVSGWRSPDLYDGRRDYELPEADFLALLRRLNGTPLEILENPEALQLLLPIVRADFELVQTYEFVDAPPLACRIKALGGLKDVSATPDLLRAWGRHTSGGFSLSLLPGGHFFIHESQGPVLTIVAHELSRLLDCDAPLAGARP